MLLKKGCIAKIFILLCVSLTLMLSMPVCVGAKEKEDGQALEMPRDEWDGFISSLPQDVIDQLPDGLFDGQEADAVKEMGGAEYILGVIGDALGAQLGSSAAFLAGICALLLLASVFNTFGSSLDNASLSSAVRFCSSGALFAAVIQMQYSHFTMLEEFFSKLSASVNGMIPVMTAIWAMGGNVSTAGASGTGFYITLSVCESICAKTVIPVVCVCTVLAVCEALSDEMKTGKLMSAIKKIYTFVLGLVMTVLLWMLGTQTSLAASADSMAARTAKLLSGAVIPIVGGSVGETLRTVAGGVGYLKNIFGVCGITVLVLTVLPVFISVLLTRFTFIITGGVADVLGCSSEGKLLEGLGELYGMILAVISGVAVMFVMMLCIFMNSVVAAA